MTSTLGIKKIQHPNGTNIATLDSSGSIAFAGASTVAGTLGVTGETTLATHLNMGDNDKIKLGASGDLEIYHDASNSYVDDTGTGRLYLRGNDRVQIQKYTGEDMVTAIADGAVNLYYDNAKKFETTSSGVTVTGNATISGELQVDTNTLKVQASDNRVGIGTGSPNYARLNIASTAAGAQERGLYIELTPASGTSPNNIAVFSATNSNMTQPLVRIHHESPTADQLMLQCTTTGSNTVKFSVDEDGDIYTAGGINVGGTGAANKLDDYEEGTFTATAGNSVTLHSNYDLMRYTKIGNMVTITGQVRVNSDNSNAGFRITNFPFAHAGNTEGNGHTFGAVRLYLWNVPSEFLYAGCFMAPSTTTCYVEYVRDNGSTVELPSTSNAYIMFGYTYPST